MLINGTVKWASVQTPNTTYEPVWSVDLYPSEEVIKQFKKLGLPVKTDKEGGEFLKIKRKVEKRDGTKNEPPIVVDAMKKPFTEMVGNGSEVNVIFDIFEWEMRGKKGKTAWLNKVQVVNLVPFGGGEDFDVVVSGIEEEDFA